MDADRLRAALPDGRGFWRLGSGEKKRSAEQFIEAILDAIGAEDRAPDDWEARDLGAAINYAAHRWYGAAITCANRALTPVEQRSPVQPRNPVPPPTADDLHRALWYVSGMRA